MYVLNIVLEHLLLLTYFISTYNQMEEKKFSFVPSPVYREEYHIYDKDTGDKVVVDCFACIVAPVRFTQKIHVSLMYKMYKYKGCPIITDDKLFLIFFLT